MRISDWSSDVCPSDLGRIEQPLHLGHRQHDRDLANLPGADQLAREVGAVERVREEEPQRADDAVHRWCGDARLLLLDLELPDILGARGVGRAPEPRSEEHTSELQSLMRTSYAVFCLKKNRHTGRAR